MPAAQTANDRIAAYLAAPSLDAWKALRTMTALDADGEEFTLDFGYPTVATRPIVTRDDDTADGRAALDSRKGRNAAWREANLIPKAHG